MVERNTIAPKRLPQKFSKTFNDFLGVKHLKSGKVTLPENWDTFRETLINKMLLRVKPEIEALLDDEAIRNYKESQKQLGITYDSDEAAQQDIISRLRLPLIQIVETQLYYGIQLTGHDSQPGALERLHHIRDEIERLFDKTDCPIREKTADDTETNPEHFNKQIFATTCISKGKDAIGLTISDMIENRSHIDRVCGEDRSSGQGYSL